MLRARQISGKLHVHADLVAPCLHAVRLHFAHNTYVLGKGLLSIILLLACPECALFLLDLSKDLVTRIRTNDEVLDTGDSSYVLGP